MSYKMGQCYDFRIDTMLGSFLPPVVCRGHAICVCLCIVVSNIYCVFNCFSSSCVPYVASFSGLSIHDCPFGLL